MKLFQQPQHSYYIKWRKWWLCKEVSGDCCGNDRGGGGGNGDR